MNSHSSYRLLSFHTLSELFRLRLTTPIMNRPWTPLRFRPCPEVTEDEDMPDGDFEESENPLLPEEAGDCEREPRGEENPELRRPEPDSVSDSGLMIWPEAFA